MSAGSRGEAISALDGRYSSQLSDVAHYMSEASLNLYRIHVEAHWLLFLADEGLLPKGVSPLTHEQRGLLKRLTTCEDLAAAHRVKTIEQTTNHDVKAVEYYVREVLTAAGAAPGLCAMVHFAATSEDINNAAYALMLKDVRQKLLLPTMDQLVIRLAGLALRYADLPMLSRTHGQSATPTTLGKELAVFGHRLQRQREQLASCSIEAKFNGAVGNYNAHKIAFPAVNWPEFTRRFLEERLRLRQNPWTTQIENHDSLVECLDAMRRFAVISIGLCRDMWSYIAIGYFKLQKVESEVGSSTMPHKVNPIDFENAEGNFGLAVSLFQHFGEKLPISRWQRDLSDSTVLRSLGTAVGHLQLAMKSTLKGLNKVEADETVLRRDLDQASEVLTEAVQTVLRAQGVADAYERLKVFSRGRPVTKSELENFIDQSHELTPQMQAMLRKLRPDEYLGEAPLLARQFASHWAEILESTGQAGH